MDELKVEIKEREQTTVEIPDIKNDLVDTAVKFLSNPQVKRRSAAEKEAFLSKKGLTSAEIAKAFQLAGQSLTESKTIDYQNAQTAAYQPVLYTARPAASKWLIIRDIGNAIVLIAGASYGLVYLFKKFILPFIFGRSTRQKNLADSINEMNTCITKLSSDLNTSMQNVLVALNQLNSRNTENVALTELKNEIATVKGLLLSSRQFPAPPPVSRPSIPSWQLRVASEKTEQVTTMTTQIQSATVSSPLSSSPEIISVDEVPASTQENAADNTVPGRDPSESSETGSSEMVEVVAGVSGEDTD